MQNRFASFCFPCLTENGTTILETIIRGVETLLLRQQVEVARHVHSLNVNAQRERVEILGSIHGVLDEADGLACE